MLPQDLRHMTPEHTEEVKELFRGMTKKELKRRIKLNEGQLNSAQNQYRTAQDPVVKERLERGISNIKIDLDLIRSVL